MNRVLRFGYPLLAILLAACGGGGGTETPPAGDNPPPAALAASAPGALIEHVRDLLRARAQAGVAGDSVPYLSASPAIVISAAAPSAPATYSNTTVQEPGVDEADLLKTDGSIVYALDTTGHNQSGALQLRLRVRRLAAGGTLEPLQTLDLPADASTYPVARGMQFAPEANRIAVLTESNTPIGTPQPCAPDVPCIQPGLLIYAPQAMASRAQVQLLDRTAAGVALGSRLTLDGRLIASRRIGSVLYLVTVHAPRLAVDLLPANTPATEREAQLARLTAAEVLPMLRIDSQAPQPLVVDTDCYVQPRNTSLTLSFTTITAIDLASPTAVHASRCFAGGTEAIYMSPNNLYLATTRSGVRLDSGGRRIYAPQFATDIHKFAFAGLAIDYRASGEVSGSLGWDPQRMSYRMGEHNGDLRVLSFTGASGWISATDAGSSVTPSPATLTVLRERVSDRSLQAVSTLPNTQRPAPLGKAGEQVYGVRFIGERGYLVTFRLTDPLYVLDLANPADPRAAGELEVPGFSDYLFPLYEGLLFGVGKDADAQGLQRGVKVALFDVRDASRPTLIAARTFGDRGSQTTLDYSSQGLNMLLNGASARIALPMRVVSGQDFSSTTALHRFEVDTVARSLQVLAAIPSASANADLSTERSVQIDSTVVYLNDGETLAAPW